MSTNEHSGKGLWRVLLVDDNEDALELLAQLLARGGELQVATASTGAQALQLAATAPPDAVVLDLGLPDMDGCEVLGRLRALAGLGETIFIALTGRSSQADVAQARSVGFDHHFVKPPDLQALRAALRQRGPRA